MDRTLRSSLASAAALALGLATGCAENKSTLFIQGVMHREAPSCIAEPDPEGVMLGSGVLDVALSGDYFATFLVGNQFTPRGDKERLRTETTRVILQGATISVNGGSGTDVTGSGVVPPSSAEDPGWGLFSALVVSGATAPGVIDVGVKVFGETLGGKHIESGEFLFPIHVCNGCLISFPSDAFAPGSTVCGSGTAEPPAATGCYFGQDDLVDCRSCTAVAACQGVP